MQKTITVEGESTTEKVVINKGCIMCEGTGIAPVAWGDADFNHEFCRCPKGRAVKRDTENV